MMRLPISNVVLRYVVKIFASKAFFPVSVRLIFCFFCYFRSKSAARKRPMTARTFQASQSVSTILNMQQKSASSQLPKKKIFCAVLKLNEPVARMLDTRWHLLSALKRSNPANTLIRFSILRSNVMFCMKKITKKYKVGWIASTHC